MAHVSRRTTDFTHPIARRGAFELLMKEALQKVFRALSGKNVKVGSTNTANANVIQAPITGLTFNVLKGKQYRITGKLLVTTATAAGIQVGLSLAGSSASTGQVNYKYFVAAGCTRTDAVVATPLSSAATGATGIWLEVDIDGYFVPDVRGALTVTFSQKVSDVSNTTINPGSTVSVVRTYSS